MDSSAVSEEEVDEQQEETSQDDQSSPNKSQTKKLVAGEIIEGKRAKKKVERLDFQAPKQREKLKIGQGSGDKLGDIPRTNFQITKMKSADLKPLHAILFDRPGKMSSIKKNLRQFNGFLFDTDSEQYNKKREKLLKNSHFTNSKLKVVCGVLDLEKKGTHSDLVDRILNFLTAPKNSGKRVPVKKKRKSKKNLTGDDSKAKTHKKSKPRSLSSSPKKSKAGSKSKAIVMDSSSDEDDGEEDEKAGASAEAEGSDAEEKLSEKEEERSEKSEESMEEEDEEEEEEEHKEESVNSKSGRAKSASKKSAPVKRQRPSAKKAAPPKKRAKKDVSDESQSDVDSEADEKPKKKSAPSKPAAKTKKADSSSNSKNNSNTVDDNSEDEDEPLIKMIKKTPSDEQLKETVQSLLKDADLEEMTMKQICQRVFDAFPDHDLTSKKDFIKQTVKSLIT